MKDQTAPDQRQQAILHSAWQAFSAYGFRKTSMDDIARGAGISRPALYLHYKNKEDIFRSLSRYYYEDATADFEAALRMPGPVETVLAQAFLVKSGEAVDAMLASPHGRELLDTKTAHASDIVEEGEARLADVLATWLRSKETEGQVTLPAPADEVARLCMVSVKAVFVAADSASRFEQDIRTLADLLGKGLARR